MTARRHFALFLVIAVAGAAQAAWQPDDLVTRRIQVALYSAPEIDPESIVVETKHGNVRLVGVVPSTEVKSRIETLVRQMEGVQSLDSALTVDATSAVPTPNPRPPDSVVLAEVNTRLAKETALNDSRIEVAKVSGGVVVLSGFANSLDDQLRALRLAKGVHGVTLVQNDMKTPPGAAHDLALPNGQARGADAQNRREQQALDGRAAETPQLVPGAPTPPHTPIEPGAPKQNVEGEAR
jgi:osmotically-inducible protein OsmY